MMYRIPDNKLIHLDPHYCREAVDTSDKNFKIEVSQNNRFALAFVLHLVEDCEKDLTKRINKLVHAIK